LCSGDLQMADSNRDVTAPDGRDRLDTPTDKIRENVRSCGSAISIDAETERTCTSGPFISHSAARDVPDL